MNTKSNHILIGLILLLLGISAFIPRLFTFNYLAAAVAVAGCAFLLMYRTKRSSGALAVGTNLLLLGIWLFFKTWFAIPGLITAGLFFLSPGIIFMVLYLDKHKRGLLIPASVLIWFAVFLAGLRVLAPVGNTLFFACIGAAFFTVYILGKGFVGRFPIYAGLAMLAAAALTFFAAVPKLVSSANVPGYMAVVCIAAGAFIILKAVWKKRR